MLSLRRQRMCTGSRHSLGLRVTTAQGCEAGGELRRLLGVGWTRVSPALGRPRQLELLVRGQCVGSQLPRFFTPSLRSSFAISRCLLWRQKFEPRGWCEVDTWPHLDLTAVWRPECSPASRAAWQLPGLSLQFFSLSGSFWKSPC